MSETLAVTVSNAFAAIPSGEMAMAISPSGDSNMSAIVLGSIRPPTKPDAILAVPDFTLSDIVIGSFSLPFLDESILLTPSSVAP